MEKARRPHVTRTWTVDRTRITHRPPQLAHLRPDTKPNFFRSPAKTPRSSNVTPGSQPVPTGREEHDDHLIAVASRHGDQAPGTKL